MSDVIFTTKRLYVRSFEPEDLAPMLAIGRNPNVARMMASIHADWTDEQAKSWIARGPYQQKLGFGAGAFLHSDDRLIGFIGVGGDPMNLGYGLDEPYWGQGFATEMVAGLLCHCYDHLGLKTLTAEHYNDNPASGRVLTKLGFEKCGESMGTSLARLEPAPQTLYRLTEQQFRAATDEVS